MVQSFKSAYFFFQHGDHEQADSALIPFSIDTGLGVNVAIAKVDTFESAEANSHQLVEKWSDKYPMAICSWENNWEDMATFFAYPAKIQRLIYTANSVKGYHWQLPSATKVKSIFSPPEAARKLLFWLIAIHSKVDGTDPTLAADPTNLSSIVKVAL